MRRFIVAPSMARLIRRERGSVRVVEGYFPTQQSRNSHVRLEGDEGQLILTGQDDAGQTVEEVTVVPRKPAEALLDVCAGRLDIERTSLAVGGKELRFERIAGNGRSIDIASVDAEGDFVAPPWLGREVGAERAFNNRALALEGIPPVETPISDAALTALIDTLENRFGAMFEPARPAEPQRRPVEPQQRQPEPPQRAPAPPPPPAAQQAAAAQRPAPPVRQDAPAQSPATPREPAAAARRAPEPQAETPAQAEPAAAQDQTPSKRMETIIQGLSKVLREPGLPAEGEAIVELDRWGGRRR
ncbi:hypothetical protein NK718_19475 [Alsobacter sp. SYSU M60028]|uniref:CYTH domain-containing protein n=1 Tax=Alsobacter ponti TaxID=2962936 RepID=A0ABT1LGT7_9HYPH|nr:hypothetical protein [Alsobacter ponti]MCP8940712.1 hypothetical protein [Alsobacter ponti]